MIVSKAAGDVYIVKAKDPITDPCGTPSSGILDLGVIYRNILRSILKICGKPAKHTSSNSVSLSKSIQTSWLIVSKAAE